MDPRYRNSVTASTVLPSTVISVVGSPDPKFCIFVFCHDKCRPRPFILFCGQKDLALILFMYNVCKFSACLVSELFSRSRKC